MEQGTSLFLAELMRDLYFQESTGVLRLEGPQDAAVDLHFDRGMLYFAEGSRDEDRFDAMLVSSGVLPEKTVARIRQLPRTGLEKADALVAKSVLTRDALAGVIRPLVEANVKRAFSWPISRSEFTAGQPANTFFDADVLFTFECILKGIMHMAEFGPLEEVLLKLPARVRLGTRVFIPVEKLALRPHHGYVLSRADGTMSVEEIALLLPSEEGTEAIQFLYGLAVLGIVEFDPPISEGLFSLRQLLKSHHEASSRDQRDIARIRETAGRIARQDPRTVLGVPADANAAAVRMAYTRLKHEFGRDQFSDRAAAECRRELNLIEKGLTEAFLKLQVGRLEQAGARTAPAAEEAVAELDTELIGMRREMMKSEAQQTAEQNEKLAAEYLQKARDYFQDNDFHNCIQFCRLAIGFTGDTPIAHALMAEALSRNPNSKWQRLAEASYLKACELDPWNADHRVALGNFYRKHGLDRRARGQFLKALEMVPGHSAAREALAAVGGDGNA